MRMAWLGGLVAITAAFNGAKAQEPLRVGIVGMDCEIRSNPGMSMPRTAKLPKGMQVRVHHTDGEFYAILPPDGSESWVNHRFLKPVDNVDPPSPRQNMAVVKETDVLVGGESGPTSIRQVKLPVGQIVEVTGPKKTYDGSTWYPVTPPKGEYRFILKSNVTIDANAVATAPNERSGWEGTLTSRNKIGTEGTLASRTGEGSNAKPAVGHSLWTQAEAAYQDGDFNKADQLFTRIYNDFQKNNSGTYDEKLMCFNRIAKCQEQLRKSGPTGDAGRFDGNGRAVEATSVSRSREGGKTSSSGPVFLRRAAFDIDGKQAYALEKSGTREVLYYATAENGVAIDGYVGKVIEATGEVRNRGDVRGVPFMSVSKVAASR